MSHEIQELISQDVWTLAEIDHPLGAGLVRFRTPVLNGESNGSFDTLLRVVWPYADEDTGALPDTEQSEQMTVFEDRLVSAWERGPTAILTAVLTIDGARQWVWYTEDPMECLDRLQSMPQEEDPYPIELDTRDDPAWHYLVNEILGRVPYDA